MTALESRTTPTPNVASQAGRPDEDRVIVVNAFDRAIGLCSKSDAHVSPGVRHRAFSVMVIDDDGRWLLQRRAQSKYHFGGRWTNSCCSHPQPGETLDDAVRRRVNEELGMRVVGLDHLDWFEYRAEDPSSGLVEHEIDHVFIARTTGEIDADPDEIDQWQWIEPKTLMAAIDDDADRYTPWLLNVASIVATVVLPANVGQRAGG